MLNPIAAPPIESLKDVQRNVLCQHYKECLEIAIERNWDNFTCICCNLFHPSGRSFDRWLEQNTIACKLGKLTPEQCEVNRGRKRLAEPFDLHDQSPEARDGLAGVFMPTACESCSDWGRLHAEFREKRGKKVSKDKQPAVKSTGELCVCKKCNGEFKSYEYGCAVVKSVCRPCLTARSSKKQKESTPDGQGTSKPRPSRNNMNAARPSPNGASCTDAPETITLVFADSDEALRQRIEEISRKERRSVDAQILYWLETCVPELKEMECC